MNVNTPYIIPGQNNGLTALNEASLESRVMRLEERIREMEKTLTILSLYPGEVLTPRAISESQRRAQIDRLVEIQMGL